MMTKTITTVFLTAVGVFFGMQNFDHVPVYIFWGKAINLRLVFVIAIAGIAGYLIRHFSGLAREDALKRQLYALRVNNGNRRRKVKRAIDFEEKEI